MWHRFVLVHFIGSLQECDLCYFAFLSYQKISLACRRAEGQNCTKVMEIKMKEALMWCLILEKCFFCVCMWRFEWLVNKKCKMHLWGKLRCWSSCCEILKDCISYLLYVCVHTAQCGFLCTQKEAAWLTVVNPDVENVPPPSDSKDRFCEFVCVCVCVCVCVS